MPGKKLGIYISIICLVYGFSGGAFAQTTVQNTITDVLSYSPSLKSIQENRQSLLHNVDQAKAGWYPRVDVTGSASLQQGSNSTIRNNHKSPGEFAPGASVGVLLSQSLWDGRSTTNLVDQALYRIESIDNRVFDNATYLALEGLIAHLDVLRRQEVLSLAERYRETHKVILEKQASLSSSGLSTTADVTQAQGRLARAKATVTDAESSLAQGVNAYAQLTGKRPVDVLAGLDIPPRFAEKNMPTLEALIDETVQGNPKIKANVADVKVAKSGIDAVGANFQPQVSLEVGPAYADPDSRIGNDYEWSMGATVRLRWNLYNGGRTQAEEKAAAATMRQMRQEVNVTTDAVLTDVRNTMVSLSAARKLVQEYSDAVTYCRSTRDAYLEQFGLGMRSLLDVLDAETELFNSETQLATVQTNVTINIYKLLALQGNLLKELGIDDNTLFVAPLNEGS